MTDKHYMAEVLGKNVIKYRIKKRMTTEELAKNTNISKRYILRIENGKAMGLKFTQAMRIASALSIKINLLFEE